MTLLTCSLLCSWRLAPAQTLSLAGTNYFENFDGIGSGLPAGWSVWTNATATGLNGRATFDPTPTAWKLATAGVFYNMASTDSTNWVTGQPFGPDEDPTSQAASTNRAPGIRLRSTTDPGAAFVLAISNTLGFINFHLSVDLMIMTTNNDRTGLWTVDYGIGDPPVSFSPLGVLGDLIIAGTNAFGKTNGSYALPAEVNNRTEKLWIRVALLTATGPSGARDTYGIDNFVLSWSVAPPASNPPVITGQPQSRTNLASTTATFTAEATGSGPLFYQWRKNGTNLTDGPKITGTTASTLIVSSLVAADAGDYSVLITNSFGSTTSQVARLTVIDPAILTQPRSRTNVVGDVARFTALPVGTLPLSFAWQFNGVPITGASGTLTNWANETLILPNLQPTHQGDYTLLVSNSVGVVTSAVVHLTLVPTPAIRIAQWTFNSNPPDDPADPTTGVTTPALGSGIATAIGGAFGAFLVGSGSDPASISGDNSGWNIKGYPPAGSANKTAGVQFDVSTAGYQDILVTWEQQNNTRASRYLRFQYTTNGTDFTDHNVIDLGGQQGEFVLLWANLGGIAGVNNNPNFAFRIVTEFENTATGSGVADYVATDPNSSYGSTAGAIRYDVVNVFGNALGSAAPIQITAVQILGNTLRIEFTAGTSDSPTMFTLQSAATVNGVYSDTSATISQLAPGVFRAERTLSAPQGFFRLRR